VTAKDDTAKSKNGRPTKYKKEFDEQARKLCLNGFIDAQIADFFNIQESTLNLWKKAHPSFMESLKSGKRYSDDKVVNALYNRAIGYEFDEVKSESGTTGKKITTTTKHIAGDTTAQIFWLRNRMRDEWTNNPEPEESDQTGKGLNITFNVSEAVKDVKVTKGE